VSTSDIVEADLKKILAMDPDNVEALNALGYTLLNKPDRYADAEKYLQQRLGLSRMRQLLLIVMAGCSLNWGILKKPWIICSKHMKKQQENEIAAHLAEVLWALGRKDEAKKLFNKAIKDAPDDEYLLDFQRRVLKGAQ